MTAAPNSQPTSPSNIVYLDIERIRRMSNREFVDLISRIDRTAQLRKRELEPEPIRTQLRIVK